MLQAGNGASLGIDSKQSACKAGDLSLIPGSGRSHGEGNGNPLWYSCLENSMDRGTWRTQFTFLMFYTGCCGLGGRE